MSSRFMTTALLPLIIQYKPTAAGLWGRFYETVSAEIYG
jgi:hypothetical protein